MKKFLAVAALAACLSAGAADNNQFIVRLESNPAPRGLDGSNIAVWQSHGWYYEPKLQRWEWQRARLFETVEDLYTQSYVVPFLMPMLENAGAYVLSPRERDVRTQEIILDNDAWGFYAETNGKNKWTRSAVPGFAFYGGWLDDESRPFSHGSARLVDGVNKEKDASTALWRAAIPEDGLYAVYISYQSFPNSARDVVYTVHTAAGPQQFRVNQRMGGGTWIYLGHFPFQASAQPQTLVSVSNLTKDKKSVVSTDAVKVGGGMGNVRRHFEDEDGVSHYVGSGRPRFTEGARYFLQWAGAPDSVFSESHYVNDYTDDYRSRGLWVNWLTGGSKMLPNQEGLNIPIDLSLAFHSDAGITPNDSIIGTLGIYCTDSLDYYPSGIPRLAARALTDSIMTNIVGDIRAQFEPNWTRRDMWNSAYAEARRPQVPAMLLELLSHQNFADMKYGLDPQFRFTVSRAIYKGILKYLAALNHRPYVVQPLPVRAFAISGGADGLYTLSWSETVDSLEATAIPAYYIVEKRVADGVGFAPIAKVNGTSFTYQAAPDEFSSFRIVAGNDGGVSFPSEVLALCYKPDAEQVLIVNGFTRVSAPDWFDSGEIAGFYDTRDHGVPYVQDISYIGEQFEFRRDIPWMDDDASGFGASRANYETAVIAGNTFDFVSIHGQAIATAGHGFISQSVEAFMQSDVASAPKVLDLLLGKQKEVQTGTGRYGTKCKTFPSALQDALRSYTAQGGSVLVTGSFIATDLWDNPHSSPEVAAADQQFATEVLGYHWRVGQASVTGEAYEVWSPFAAFSGGAYKFSNTLNPDMYVVESPDALYAADKRGATIMRYSENNLVAGIAYDPGTYRTVVLGFPFETILSADSRNFLMRQILEFFKQ